MPRSRLSRSWSRPGTCPSSSRRSASCARPLRAARPSSALPVPLIYYVNQGSHLMSAVAPLDVDVIGVDWRTGLAEVRRVLGPGKAVQGNLDPAALFAPPEALRRRVDAVLEQAGPDPGHIFNLGHGIWPDTDPDAVARLIDYVHERG